MVRDEIEEYWQRLVDIQKEEEARVRLDKLIVLAKEVGASTLRMGVISEHAAPNGLMPMPSNVITEIEIVSNIHSALQTASMISMYKVANRNFIIALIATIIALGSTIAVWIAVCK